MESNAVYDRYLSIFSPEGRLYQIEYAFNAVKSFGNLAVGIKGKDCVVVLSQKKVTDNTVDMSDVTNLYRITDHIGCLMTGLPADCYAQVGKAREEATEFKFKYGYEIPISVLAKKVADNCQIKTQRAEMRVFGCIMILAGIDDETGPAVYKIDPAGNCWSFKGTSGGNKAQEATNYLEKQMEGNKEFSFEETVELGLSTIQTVFGSDISSSDVEVGCVQNGKYWTVLTRDEIDTHLNHLTERD
ncbi:hypothetical protein WA158_000275 [Blastocystis sp. Blastoise]